MSESETVKVLEKGRINVTRERRRWFAQEIAGGIKANGQDPHYSRVGRGGYQSGSDARAAKEGPRLTALRHMATSEQRPVVLVC